MLIPVVIASLAHFTIACEKEEGENETKISSYQSDESHHTGENCMECHRSGGSGEGWFTIAGTVYGNDKTTPYPGATVRLYTGQGGSGTLKTTVEVDQKGNFYTTEGIDFGTGLYTRVEGASTTAEMVTPLTTGQCSQCHGNSTGRIGIE